MGDFQNQQVGAEQDDLQNRDAQQQAKSQWPATAEVRSLIASGQHDAAAIAQILNDHPRAREEIMALLHQTLGNKFAMKVAAENKKLAKADADGTTKPEDARPTNEAALRADANDFESKPKEQGPASGSKNDPMAGFREMNDTNRGIMPTAGQDQLRADTNDNAPLNTPTSGKGIETDAEKAKAAALIADTDEQTLGKGPVSAQQSGVKDKASKSPSKAVTDEATAEVLKDDPRNPAMAKTAQESGVKDESPKEAKAPDVAEAPVEASKILKDETVIGSSKEEKPVEIVRQSEVLKDPQQNPEEPKKASDEVKEQEKDHDGESESEGGAGKSQIGPVKITASVLRIRSSPKISKGNIIGRLTRGTVVQAVGHQGEWVEIQHNGQTAFVHSSFVAEVDVKAQPTAQEQLPATPAS